MSEDPWSAAARQEAERKSAEAMNVMERIMSRDQYDTRPPIFPSEEVRAHEAFMCIAVQWFNTDERTLRGWLANTEPVANLISNLRAVFTAGYVLGRRDGESN